MYLRTLIADGYMYNQHEIGAFMILLVTYIDNFYVYVILFWNSYLKIVIQMFHVASCYNYHLCKMYVPTYSNSWWL